MFDLELIEKEWYLNNHQLNINDIYEIYQQEHVTYEDYLKELNAYLKENGYNTIDELESLKATGRISKKKIKEILNDAPNRKTLSKESQLKVIDGCLNYVFNNTKKWYKAFNNKIDMEEIYDVCLEALIITIKNACPYDGKTLKNHINKEIKKEIIYYMACKENISFNKSEKIIKDIKFDYKGNIIDYKDDFNYEYDNIEPMEPRRIKKYIIKKETNN